MATNLKRAKAPRPALSPAQIEAAYADVIETEPSRRVMRKLRREKPGDRSKHVARQWKRYLADGGDPTSEPAWKKWLKEHKSELLALLLNFLMALFGGV